MVAPSSPSEKPRLRFSLRVLLLVLTLLSVWFALGTAWGMHGLILPFDLFVAARAIASITGTQRLFGVAVRKMTLSEFFVMGAICFVLHGLATPPMSIE